MNVEEIKKALVRKAIIFTTGGIRPTKELYESWIGRVGFCISGESVPVDAKGNEMLPLAMLFVK